MQQQLVARITDLKRRRASWLPQRKRSWQARYVALRRADSLGEQAAVDGLQADWPKRGGSRKRALGQRWRHARFGGRCADDDAASAAAAKRSSERH